jgi:hypothetical protein
MTVRWEKMIEGQLFVHKSSLIRYSGISRSFLWNACCVSKNY